MRRGAGIRLHLDSTEHKRTRTVPKFDVEWEGRSSEMKC